MRSALVGAIIQHSSLLLDGNGSAVLQNIEDIDCSQIVSFHFAQSQNQSTLRTPSPAATEIGRLLATIAGLACFAVLSCSLSVSRVCKQMCSSHLHLDLKYLVGHITNFHYDRLVADRLHVG